MTTKTKLKWLSDYVKAAIEVSHVRELKPNAFNVLKEQMDKVPHPAMVYTNITPLVKAAKETKFEYNTKVFKKVLYYALLSRPEVDIETCFVKQLGKKSIDQVVVENILYISRYLFPAQRFEKEVFETGDNITNLTRQLQHEFAVEWQLDNAFYWKVPEECPKVTVYGVDVKTYFKFKNSSSSRISIHPSQSANNTIAKLANKPRRLALYSGDYRYWYQKTEEGIYGFNKLHTFDYIDNVLALCNYYDSGSYKTKEVDRYSYYLSIDIEKADENLLDALLTTESSFTALYYQLEKLKLIGRTKAFKVFVKKYLYEAMDVILGSVSATNVSKLTIIKKYIEQYKQQTDTYTLEDYAKWLVSNASVKDLKTVVKFAVFLLEQKATIEYGTLTDSVFAVDVSIGDDGKLVYGDPKVVYEPSDDGKLVYGNPKVTYEPGESRSDSDNFEAVYGPDQLAAMSTEEMIQKDLIHIKIYDWDPDPNRVSKIKARKRAKSKSNWDKTSLYAPEERAWLEWIDELLGFKDES